jgi:hypothetical protein
VWLFNKGAEPRANRRKCSFISPALYYPHDVEETH